MMAAGFFPVGIPVTASPFQHYFRRFTTRVVRWWEQNRPYPVRKKWSSLPPVRSLATPGPTLLVLTTPPMLDESAWCAWSWARYLGNSFRVVVASDGGLPSRFQEIKSILPDAEITQAAAIAQAGDPGHIHLAAFLSGHPLGRKLAAILALQKSQDLLFFDSDVLALAPPVSLLAMIARRQPCFNQESQPAAYDWEIVEAGRQLGLSPCDRLNSGLLYIPKNSLDAGLADRLLAGRSSPAISWFTEQTVLAFLMHAAGAQPLPPERYVVSNDRMFWWQEDIDYAAVDARHFTGMTRHLLYMRGYPHLRGSAASRLLKK